MPKYVELGHRGEVSQQEIMAGLLPPQPDTEPEEMPKEE